ncbi:outer dense fiber protein 2-like isoform X2 [Denticeps clupeoides]|uniref:outer dense fiber protein 2-like isoform X2 n=1 Tax=Denticeps clupeoides TaxID=299321 RepID=UPI0010A5538E|nr:outer dense fiber protein 2-like isoform X2 [Denticeps clupeoides]
MDEKGRFFVTLPRLEPEFPGFHQGGHRAAVISTSGRLADLSNDEGEEEEGRHVGSNKYEQQVETLMADAGSLKKEGKLKERQQLIERQTDQLSSCQHLIDVQEEKITEASKELKISKHKNLDLRNTLGRMHEETRQRRAGHNDIDTLLKKLVEAEIDGAGAAKQVSILIDTMGKITKDKKMSQSDTTLLRRQHRVLTKKLEMFENTIHILRHLLREHHGHQTDALRLSEEREALLKRLAFSEAEKLRLENKLSSKAKESSQLGVYMETEKAHTKTTGELSKLQESTRACLQTQLHKKEAENGRLGVQLLTMEEQLKQQEEEIRGLQEQIQELQKQCDVDKEALKQASHAQKLRAERSEGTAGQLSAQLVEKEAQLAEALFRSEGLHSRYTREVKEKSQLEVEITVLKNRVTEMMDELLRVEDKARIEKEELLERLHRITSENSSTRLESQRLKMVLSTTEERLNLSHSEAQQLKTTVRDFEKLVEGYKSQLQKTRLESEEYSLKLKLSEKETQSAQAKLDREVEKVHKELMGRLKDLEPLPEALKQSDMHLKEAREQLQTLENRNTEQHKTILELRNKAEHHSVRFETLHDKHLQLLEENKQLRHSVESAERKLEEANIRNRDLAEVSARNEERRHSIQLRLEERSKECDVFSKQVENSREETKRQIDQCRERSLSKERTMQSKVLDLETQLSLAKTEYNQLRRSKEEMERRLQSKLQDMKGKLDQSDSSNRSLQNHVHYLTSSYTNVFGDPLLTSSLYTSHT